MTIEIDPQLIDLAEAGRIARLSWAGINYHAKVGHLPTQKVFKNRLVNIKDLAAFLECKEAGEYQRGKRKARRHGS